MNKSKYIDHLEQMDQVKEGLTHLQKYGQKTFKDSEGNWVEQKTAKQPNFFDSTVEIIPHEVAC